MDVETTSHEAEALRARIDALEREQHERTARANAALAAAQDRAYWLDRWGLDLNALMRRRGASEFRAGPARGARGLPAGLRRPRPRALAAGQAARGPALAVEEERGHAEERPAARFARTLSPDPLRRRARDRAALRAPVEPRTWPPWSAGSSRRRRRSGRRPTTPDRKRLTLAFAVHHGAGRRARAQRAERGHAARRRALDGPRPAGRRRLDLLRGPGGRRRSPRPASTLGPGMSGLDFGCSSGRVVRVLAAAYPELDWHGCDPIPDAIEWARANLPGIAFERSPEYPPLPYADGAVRPRLRDLDLDALRRGRGARLAARDAPRACAPAGAC